MLPQSCINNHNKKKHKKRELGKNNVKPTVRGRQSTLKRTKVTSRYNRAFSWVLGPHFPGFYIFSLDVSLNIIFIVLNIRLKEKRGLELTPSFNFRANY